MDSSADKLRAELKKKKVPELKKQCKELKIPDCLTKISQLRKTQLIELIVLAQSSKKAPKKKAPKKKRSPKKSPKKRSPKKSPKKRSPKRAPKKKGPSEGELSKKTVGELKKIVENKGYQAPQKGKGSGAKGRIVKKDWVQAIMDARAKVSPLEEIIIPSPVRKSAREYKCYPDRKRKCAKGSDKSICSTARGTCRKTKTVSKKQKEEGYIYDDELGLIGPTDEIAAYREYLGVEEEGEEEGPAPPSPRRRLPIPRKRLPIPRRPLPKPKKRGKKPLPALPRPRVRKCYDKEDWLECDPDQVCWSDGTCKPSAMREGLWILKVEGRDYDIVGDEDHIKRLQKEIGGDIISPEIEEVIKEKKVRKPKEKGKEKIKAHKKKPTKRKKPSAASEAKKADVRKTFVECLESLTKQVK